MQTALRTFLISVSYIPKSVRIAKHSLFPRRSSKLCSSRVLKFFIVSFPFVYSRILTRLFPFGKYIRSIPTPHTGFEPASHYGPTVFKTAPSPPGHTAYKNPCFRYQDIVRRDHLLHKKFQTISIFSPTPTRPASADLLRSWWNLSQYYCLHFFFPHIFL